MRRAITCVQHKVRCVCGRGIHHSRRHLDGSIAAVVTPWPRLVCAFTCPLSAAKRLAAVCVCPFLVERIDVGITDVDKRGGSASRTLAHTWVNGIHLVHLSIDAISPLLVEGVPVCDIHVRAHSEVRAGFGGIEKAFREDKQHFRPELSHHPVTNGVVEAGVDHVTRDQAGGNEDIFSDVGGLVCLHHLHRLVHCVLAQRARLSICEELPACKGRDCSGGGMGKKKRERSDDQHRQGHGRGKKRSFPHL
mmetsp:Transcript_44334/g.115229  ORF Transcript_44334/g.115229 Transcript_44334/m.115229 type:complete len:249 (+) Transcript_44334:1331-2077(+)